jgi:hypothetical protein
MTVVEVLCAATVLVVAVLATLSTQLGSLELVQQSRDTEIATADLRAAMERVLLASIDEIPTTRFPPGISIPEFDDKSLTNERIVPSYPGWAAGAPLDPLPIELALTFNDRKGRPRTLRFSTFKTR